jgi:PncC family amidohydrolase
LGVKTETLETHGAVSGEVVEEMLKGLFEKTGCDYGIAVSGVAGPSGGTTEKPVGTVWAAIGRKGEKSVVWRMQGRANREMVITYSVNMTLGKLYLLLSKA